MTDVLRRGLNAAGGSSSTAGQSITEGVKQFIDQSPILPIASAGPTEDSVSPSEPQRGVHNPAQLNAVRSSKSSEGGTTIDLETGQSSASVRQQKMRTSHVVIFMCLNVGSDAPDIHRIEPCAKLECWMDPGVAQSKVLSKGSDAIAEALEAQYKTLHKDAQYKRYVESTADDARLVLQRTRQKAKDGRVLVHYNGHGMPKATQHGEIWFFDRDHSHYFPMHIADLASNVDSPSIYVFDCCNAGALLPVWHEHSAQHKPKDILLCACSEGEMLPMNPLLPYDMFTSCLTTPLKVALEWYIHYSHRQILLPGVTPELIRNVPGDLSNRRTPLGELQWILTAITDTIAWCTFPTDKFYALFRHDVMLRSLLRNFLLADKIMREMGVTPQMYPPLPNLSHLHPMWQSWDVALEAVLAQLPALKANPSAYSYQPSSFFRDQLTAFEVWLEVGDPTQHPEQLPTIVLALQQTSLRVHALALLAHYFENGEKAVRNGLSCGALMYLIKTFGSLDTLPISIVVWLLIHRVEPDVATTELIKAGAELYLMRVLQLEAAQMSRGGAEPAVNPLVPPIQVIQDVSTVLEGELTGLGVQAVASSAAFNITSPASQAAPTFPSHRSLNAPVASSLVQPVSIALPSIFYSVRQAPSLPEVQAGAFALLCAVLGRGGEKVALQAWNRGLMPAVLHHLSSPFPELRSWGCLAVAIAAQHLPAAKYFLSMEYAKRRSFIHPLLADVSPIVRSSCVHLLSSLIGERLDLIKSQEDLDRRADVDRDIMERLLPLSWSVSTSARVEVVTAATRAVLAYLPIAEQFVRQGDSVDQEFYLSPNTGSGGAVASTLSKADPTDNATFRRHPHAVDAVVFQTTFPPFAPNDAAMQTAFAIQDLTPSIQSILYNVTHDAWLILTRGRCSSDPAVSRAATAATQSIQSVVSAVNPGAYVPRALASSHRVKDQVRRFVTSFLLTQSIDDANESSRHRVRRNTDLAHQALIVAASRPSPPFESESPFKVHIAAIAGQSPDFNPQCAVFRSLEAHVVACDRRGKVIVASFEQPLKPQVIREFTLPVASSTRSLHLVNDLSNAPSLLVHSTANQFSLISGAWETASHESPKTVLSFGLPVDSRGADGLGVSQYRSDGILFAWAPRNAICGVSLIDETIIYSATVDVPVTALCCDGKVVLAGCGDGTLRAFDERQAGGLSLMHVFEAERSETPGILEVSAISGGVKQILVTHQNVIKVFDLRNRKVLRRFEPGHFSNSTPANYSTSSVDATSSRRLLPSSKGPAFLHATAHRHVPLMTVCLAPEYTIDLCKTTGESLLPRPTRSKDPPSSMGPGASPASTPKPSSAAFNSANASANATTSSSIPGGAFAAHPMKPILCLGRELFFVTDSPESKLKTAFAI